MLSWANQFSIFCFLDNNNYNCEHGVFECLLAVSSKKSFQASAGNVFSDLKQFANKHKNEYLFGHFSYDVKNEIETLTSSNPDGIAFADCSFFVPETIVNLSKNECTISSCFDCTDLFNQIDSTNFSPLATINNTLIKSRFTKDEYIATIKKLQEHIHKGDCYEINFCQEFFSENTIIEPLEVYKKLTVISPNPFSAFYKWNDTYCLCASPERYLKKETSKLISQPIKGTAKRNLIDAIADEESKNYLQQSQKEKSENVMVVDLVRNDLSKVCEEGTVKVDELFGIYSFPQVHQMISTISGKVNPELDFTDIIKATFPMGSMTGAPKKRVMELIEQYEKTKRGLFSGAIGYVTPNGNFDFNVIIRSIFYNATSGYLSYQTGGGITIYSNAEKEYEECLLKAEAILQAIN